MDDFKINMTKEQQNKVERFIRRLINEGYAIDPFRNGWVGYSEKTTALVGNSIVYKIRTSYNKETEERFMNEVLKDEIESYGLSIIYKPNSELYNPPHILIYK